MSQPPEKQSFLGSLLDKLADVKKTADEAKIKVDALIKEVKRQINQTSPQKGGNPITGEGVTKSAEED